MQNGPKARLHLKMPFLFFFFFSNESSAPVDLAVAGCKTRACRGLWLASRDCKTEMPHMCCLCKVENWAQGGRGDGGKNLYAVGRTKPSIRLSGASRGLVPAWSNGLVGEAVLLDASPWKVSHVFCCKGDPRLAAAFQPEGGQGLSAHFPCAEHAPPRKWG